ncbi:hypothetical protein PTTG_29673 [Puccinia triticina 1-1 BBBD Race 1]|uniref:Uncharacterized protein n=1 Tax=Puccinia triticina (isolate 1-1 / race 1 (BBBD)) TaxID=630390 RepID=A0A180G2L2_PUCT1|nr:hypothetical protein PTTG_29673 [Puccinia triticina 1-1 BBBD Race 1]
MARFPDALQRDLEAADQSSGMRQHADPSGVNWSVEHRTLQNNGEAPCRESQASHQRHEVIIDIPDEEGRRSGITPTTSLHSHDHGQIASPNEIVDNGVNKEDGSQLGQSSQTDHQECIVSIVGYTQACRPIPAQLVGTLYIKVAEHHRFQNIAPKAYQYERQPRGGLM